MSVPSQGDKDLGRWKRFRVLTSGAAQGLSKGPSSEGLDMVGCMDSGGGLRMWYLSELAWPCNDRIQHES